MSSPQIIDTAKMEAQIDRFLRDSERDRQKKAADSAMAKRVAANEGKDGDYDTTNALAQLGRPLSREVLIERLSKLNPHLIFERSRNFPNIGAVIIDPTANMTDLDPSCRGRRHVVGMEWGISPEFTTRKVEKDEFGQPQMKGQIRGWRTILQRLIKERLISLSEAERIFSISRGRQSQRWHETLQ